MAGRLAARPPSGPARVIAGLRLSLYRSGYEVLAPAGRLCARRLGGGRGRAYRTGRDERDEDGRECGDDDARGDCEAGCGRERSLGDPLARGVLRRTRHVWRGGHLCAAARLRPWDRPLCEARVGRDRPLLPGEYGRGRDGERNRAQRRERARRLLNDSARFTPYLYQRLTKCPVRVSRGSHGAEILRIVDEPTSARRLRLRYPAECSVCESALPAGTEA